MSIEKYIGRTVEIIYLDKKGNFSQRSIILRSIQNGKVLAYDMGKKSFRTFDADRIYSGMPVKHYA